MVISALAARTQFGQIMRRASQQQERFVVDKRGEPQVVIMGVRDFLKAVSPESGVMAAIRTEARRNKKSALTMRQIDQEIAAFRRERRLSNATSIRPSSESMVWKGLFLIWSLPAPSDSICRTKFSRNTPACCGGQSLEYRLIWWLIRCRLYGRQPHS